MSQQQQFSIPHNTPQSRANTNHINILDELLASGVIAHYQGSTAQSLLLMAAGYAKKDVRHHDFRQFWCYQSDWAEKLGVSRKAVNDNMKRLVKDGVLAAAGKRHQKGKKHPANVYQVAYAEDIAELLPTLTRKVRNRNTEGLQRGQERVRTGLHIPDNNVSPRTDSNVSPRTDTLDDNVSPRTDTEGEVRSEREKERDLDISLGKNGRNFNGNGNPNGLDENRRQKKDLEAEIERQRIAVNKRMHEILNAALPREKHYEIIQGIKKAVQKGETPEEKHEIAVQEVEQLELELDLRLDEAVQDE